MSCSHWLSSCESLKLFEGHTKSLMMEHTHRISVVNIRINQTLILWIR
jgi:hypothetical protein